MRLDSLVLLLGVGLGVMSPALAEEEYFSCQYSPRCQAIQKGQCAPDRNLKDKLSLIRLHNSADEVERTWMVLAGLEPEYCGRLGVRGSIVRDFVNFRTKSHPKAPGGICATPQECAEAFVKSTRERWGRDDLEAKIKADLERNSAAAMGVGARVRPVAPPSAEAIAPNSWQTTTEVARPTRTTRTGTFSSN